MFINQGFNFEQLIPQRSGEIIFRSGDMRIVGWSKWATPITVPFADSDYNYVQIAIDKHHRIFLYFRFDWPADRYYGPHEVVVNHAEAREFADLQLANFRWQLGGEGRLTIWCTPAIAGGVCYSLTNVMAEDGRWLEELFGKLKQPEKQKYKWLKWF